MGLLDAGETGYHGHLTAAQQAWVAAHAPHDNQASATKVCLWCDGYSACLAVKLNNRTGGNTTKGYIVSPSTSYDESFIYTPVNAADPTGVILEAGIANGSACWVAVSGLAQVYFTASTTRRHFVRASVTADGLADGQAIAEALPGSPFATDKHFQEVGHVYEARTGAGLAVCMIQFN